MSIMTEKEARAQFAEAMAQAAAWRRIAEESSNPDTSEYANSVADSIERKARAAARAWARAQVAQRRDRSADPCDGDAHTVDMHIAGTSLRQTVTVEEMTSDEEYNAYVAWRNDMRAELHW